VPPPAQISNFWRRPRSSSEENVVNISEPDAPTPPTATATTSPYASCEECGAPLDENQRYCVVCATRRKHVADPAAAFMSAATSRSRSAARRERAGAPPPRRNSSLGTALLIALIPVAVLLGVLVGHNGNGNDSKLLAAIRAQKPEVVNVGGGGTAETSASTGAGSTVDVSTSFPVSSGYAVELTTLPTGTSQSAASAAESAATAKGATGVGIISVSGYTITPKPSGGAFVVYSGHYSSRAAAAKALSKLKKAFPGATVISVKASSGGAGGGKVVSKTQYGSATQAAGYKPSKASLAQGGAVASGVAKKIGKSYVGAQSGLPSVVSVP
jgi:hypothetical protein